MNQSYLNSMRNAVLSLRPSKAVHLLLMVLSVCLFADVASAQTNTWSGASKNNNWSTAANWSLDLVPTSAHDVVIPGGKSAIIDISTAICKSVNVNGSLTLGNNMNDRNLTVSGDVTINSGGTIKSGGNGGNSLLIGGNIVNNGTFDMNVGSADTDVTFTGMSIQTIGGVGSIMDFNSLTLINASSFVINREITVNRNWTNNGKTVSGSGNVTLTGICIVGGSAVTAFPNLTVTGSVTQAIDTNVSGNFKLLSGIFHLNNATSYSLTILGNYTQTAGVFNFNAGSSGTSTMYVAGNFTNSSGISSILTAGTNAPNGTIIFNGTNTQILTIQTSRAAEWVKYVVNAGSTVQLASNLTLSSADVTTQALYTGELKIFGTFNLGNYQITQAGGVTGAAQFTLNTGATLITANIGGIAGSVSSTNITRSFSTGANYVFNGMLSQITSSGMPATVNNLTVANTLGVTLSNQTTVTNNFYITSGSKANVGTFTHTAGTLTIGDEGAIAGSWGSTLSPATNKNNILFAATTGIVNVNTPSYTTTIWDGISWTKGTPTSGKNIIFNAGYTSLSSISGNSCLVSGGNVIINAGHNLILGDKLTVNAPGTLTFENNASLVQTAFTGANISNVIYKRTTSLLANNYDFVYWGAPVKGQPLGTMWMASNWADTFYNFDSQANDWLRNVSTDLMTPGKGYIARARNGQSGLDYNNGSSTFNVGGTWTAKFYGVPNNGNVTVTNITNGNSCLLANPYPSAIDADIFLSANSGLDGTIYFWTHNTKINGNTYTSDDYASYNIVGGVAASALSDINHLVGGADLGVKPSGKIAAGQAFFAGAVSSADVVFNNNMRVTGGLSGVNNSQFFKTTNPKAKTANTIEKNRIWLNLSNDLGAFKQTLVGYLTNATNDYDSRFDGESYDGNEFVDFYSLNQDKNLVIQGRALPFDDNDEVPLGYRTTIDGTFTINIDQVDGVLTNQAVFIEDKLTNTVFDLKSANYTFTTAAGTFNDRFVLKYTNKTLSVDTIEKEDGILAFYSNNYNMLIIHNDSVDTTVNSVSLFNIAGQNIGVWDVKDSLQTNIQIPIKKISSGIYIVKVKTTNGESSKKIMVN